MKKLNENEISELFLEHEAMESSGLYEDEEFDYQYLGFYCEDNKDLNEKNEYIGEEKKYSFILKNNVIYKEIEIKIKKLVDSEDEDGCTLIQVGETIHEYKTINISEYIGIAKDKKYLNIKKSILELEKKLKIKNTLKGFIEEKKEIIENKIDLIKLTKTKITGNDLKVAILLCDNENLTNKELSIILDKNQNHISRARTNIKSFLS
jgi:hypothetical protein